MESKAILSIVTVVAILIFNPIIAFSDSDTSSIDTTVDGKITTISVTTDKTSYTDGDPIKISGKVTNPDSVSKVTLIVKAPNGNLVSISQHDLNYDDTFSATLTAGGALMKVFGTYQVVVQYASEYISDSVNFYYSASVTVPTQTTASMKVLGLPYYVEYTISGGKLLSIIPDTIANSLMLSINSYDNDNGFISVELPRKLIDAKLGNNIDDNFFVLVDDNEVEFKEKTTTSSTRTIMIKFQAESKKLEIIGTHVESKQPTAYTPTKTTDSVAPLLLVPENILVNTQDSKVSVNYTVKAIDDVDGILQPVCNPSSDTYFAIGDTLVTCSARDYAGNKVQEKFLVTIINENQIPVWIKDVAGFWCSGEINDAGFIEGIQYLIENNVIVMPKTTPNFGNSGEIPKWVKNNACWWSEGAISDKEFSNGIQYLISNGIIQAS